MPVALPKSRRSRRRSAARLGLILLVGCSVSGGSGCRDQPGASASRGPDGAAGPPLAASPLERLCARANAACAALQAAAPENLLRAKLGLEARLARQSGHPFVCPATPGECLAAYAEYLALDWEKSNVAAGLPIFVAADVPAAAGQDQLVLPLRSTLAQRESQLGVAVLPAAEHDVRELLAASPDGESPACGDRQAFYDRLLAKDEVTATIVFGYPDQHLESIRGYIRHVLLKWDPIPVFLRAQAKMLAELRSRLVSHGYVEASSSPTELRLWRRFYYRERPKTLRVHVVFSAARCPDEPLDEFGRLWRYDDQTCPEQQRATAYARGRFVDGFTTSEILMYHGHSRRGRGLDFGPMSLGDGRLQLDCSTLACGQGSSPPSLLLLDSCDAVGYYAGSITKLRQALPAGHPLAWLGVEGDVITSNAPQTSLRLLDMLIETKCPREILAVLNLPRQLADTARFRAEGF